MISLLQFVPLSTVDGIKFHRIPHSKTVDGILCFLLVYLKQHTCLSFYQCSSKLEVAILASAEHEEGCYFQCKTGKILISSVFLPVDSRCFLLIRNKLKAVKDSC